MAMTLNKELAKGGLELLDDEEVFKRTQEVWQDAQDGKLETWVGREGVARLTGRELQVLCELDARTGPELNSTREPISPLYLVSPVSWSSTLIMPTTCPRWPQHSRGRSRALGWRPSCAARVDGR